MKRPRINPRQTVQSGISPSGRPRLRVLAIPRAATEDKNKDLPLRTVPEPQGTVLVVLDAIGGFLKEHDLDVIGAARLIAEALSHTVSVAAFGIAADIRWDLAGADRVILLSRRNIQAYSPEADCHVVLSLVDNLKPNLILMPDTTPGLGDVGRRLAIRLSRPVATSVHSVSPSRITASADGGRSNVEVTKAYILLLEPECALHVSGSRYLAIMETHCEAEESSCPGQIIDDGYLPRDLTNLSLRESEFIVSAGNGVTNWEAFHTLASKLNATIGCTRPICDQGHLPKSRQIGASGELVSAKCYIALGVSGAPQHLQGIAKCRRVVAVNTNPHVDMMRRADLGIVADVQEVMPALIRNLAVLEDTPT